MTAAQTLVCVCVGQEVVVVVKKTCCCHCCFALRQGTRQADTRDGEAEKVGKDRSRLGYRGAGLGWGQAWSATCHEAEKPLKALV